MSVLELYLKNEINKYILFVCLFLKERRKVYEANLEKVGLELETEDKSVRLWFWLLYV